MRTAKPPRRKKYRNQNPASVRKPLQGVLLLERAANKYQAHDDARKFIDKINKLFERKGNKLILSTSGDEIYYLNDHLEQALKILEDLS